MKIRTTFDTQMENDCRRRIPSWLSALSPLSPCLVSENKNQNASRVLKLTRWAFRIRHKCSVLVVDSFAALTVSVAWFPVPGRVSVLSGRARMALSRRSRHLAPLFRKQVIVSACNRLAGTDSGPAEERIDFLDKFRKIYLLIQN